MCTGFTVHGWLATPLLCHQHGGWRQGLMEELNMMRRKTKQMTTVLFNNDELKRHTLFTACTPFKMHDK